MGYIKNTYSEYWREDSELKAHSSALTNERISALLVLLDEAMITAKLYYNINNTKKALVYVKQIWKNFRPVVRSNAFCRRDLKLETKVDGVYTIDVRLAELENLVLLVELGKLQPTIKLLKTLNEEIENLEIMVRDVMQYFQFTFRLAIKSKPDIFEATERLSEAVDKRTEEELLEIVGKNNKVKWSEFVKQNLIKLKQQEEQDDN